MQLTFWICVALMVYVYVGYPMLLALIARLRPAAPVARHPAHAPPVSLFISAYNEEQVIRGKLENALDLDYPPRALEIIVISDASSDATDAIVREFAARGVHLLRMPERSGKTLGLNAGVAAARGELLVFSDANAMYDRGTLRALAACFADPSVGVVTGESRYRDASPHQDPGSAGSEGVYWKYEQLIKRLESRVGSLVGGDGAIYAVRRALYQPMRASDLSDYVNPLQVVAQGYRNVYEPNAVCYEDGGDTFEKEYRRKVRIVNRAWRATIHLAHLLNPLRHGLVAWQILSHKVLRWLVPLFQLGALASNFMLLDAGAIYRIALGAQLLFYGFALCGALWSRRGGLPRTLAVPYYFCLVNAASLQGIVEYYGGRNYTTWKTVRQA